MNKKILIWTVLTSLVFFTSACSDFLDEQAKTGNNESVYLTANGLTGLVNACYTYTRGWYGKEAALGLSECGTDLWLAGRDNKQKSLVEYSAITPATSSTMLDQYWEMFYSAINACNTAVYYCDKNTDLSSTALTQYKGEALFLRAFYYWHVVETWGAAPLMTEPTSSSSSEVLKKSPEEIYTQMLEDVNNAITYLSDKQTKNGRVNVWAAKALKARLLLYLASEYAGGNYTGGQNQAYLDAAAVAQEVIAGSGASFYTNYADCWSGANEDGKVNTEAIWYIEYSSNLAENALPKRLNDTNWDQMIIRAPSASATTLGGNCLHLMFTGMWNNHPVLATKILVRTDSEIKKTILAGTTPTYVGSFFQPYSKGFTRYAPSGYLLDLMNENKDQRYKASFRDTYKTFPALVVNKTSTLLFDATALTTDTVIYLSKHRDADLTADEIAAFNGGVKSKYIMGTRTLGTRATPKFPMYANNEGSALSIGAASPAAENFSGNNLFISLSKFDDYGTTSDGSLPIIRDLGARDFFVFRLSEMYLIKAEAELGSGSGDPVATLNVLRAARAIPAQDNSIASCDIQTILDERAIELCGEQIRWFDLKRLGKLTQAYLANKNLDASVNIQAHHRLRPIPQVQMDAVTNKATFLQNPGY